VLKTVTKLVSAGERVPADDTLRWRRWCEKQGEYQEKLTIRSWSVENA
jgi:hypothetical protein